MKTKWILLFMLCGICSTFADISGPQTKIVNYGLLILPSGQSTTQNVPQSPSGVAHIFDSFPTITATTNRISAKLGSAFGMIFEISDPVIKDGDSMDIQVAVSYPTITKPDGSKSQGFVWPNKAIFREGKTWSFVDYSFDHDYELVKGQWRFEIMYGGKILCSQDFTVY